jgi:hypothetical protein
MSDRYCNVIKHLDLTSETPTRALLLRDAGINRRAIVAKPCVNLVDATTRGLPGEIAATPEGRRPLQARPLEH